MAFNRDFAADAKEDTSLDLVEAPLLATIVAR